MNISIAKLTGLLLVLMSCSVAQDYQPYKLNAPDEIHKLPGELNEISGLYMHSDSILLALQDEKAQVYMLNLQGEIQKVRDFGKDGDFEGICKYGKHTFALRSDGTLVRFKDKSGKTKHYDFPKKGHFDFEGLCADTARNRLLVACKTHSDRDKNNHIYVYAFDLEEMKYEKEPAFKIKKKSPYGAFAPSAIAIHPNGDIYLLSSVAKILMRISTEGEVLNVYHLYTHLFNQPEGMAFASNGDLYISNEQKNTKPTLLKFSMR